MKTHWMRLFVISEQAAARIQEQTGEELSPDEAYSTFCQSEHLLPAEAIEQGFDLAYQPQYHSGRRSWYFLLPDRVRKLVAIITEGTDPGEFEWTVTGVLSN